MTHRRDAWNGPVQPAFFLHASRETTMASPTEDDNRYANGFRPGILMAIAFAAVIFGVLLLSHRG